MAWDIYGNHLRPGYCEVHPDVHESWPCSECRAKVAQRQAERVPEPTPEDYCEAAGHPYHGKDEDGGRCYCGARRYPIGGPNEGDGAQ